MRRIHTSILTEPKGNMILLLGCYRDIYGKVQRELLQVNPSQSMVKECRHLLASKPTDLRKTTRHIGPRSVAVSTPEFRSGNVGSIPAEANPRNKRKKGGDV